MHRQITFEDKTALSHAQFCAFPDFQQFFGVNNGWKRPLNLKFWPTILK